MKSLTQLVGTTASNSSTLYPDSFTSKSLNNTAQNVAFGKAEINNQHRYLLQKYFNNESTYSITTIGANVLTITTGLAVGDISATLTYAWGLPSISTSVTFSDGEQRQVSFIKGSTAITWQNGLVGTKFLLTSTVLSAATS